VIFTPIFRVSLTSRGDEEVERKLLSERCVQSDAVIILSLFTPPPPPDEDHGRAFSYRRAGKKPCGVGWAAALWLCSGSLGRRCSTCGL